MDRRIPDEYFRRDSGSDGSADQRSQSPGPRRRTARLRTRLSPPLKARGIAPRALIIVVALALVAGFFLGRTLILQRGVEGGGIEPASPSGDTVSSRTSVPYEGPVTIARPATAEGTCLENEARQAPRSLIDGDPNTIWKCPGSGKQESVTFTFPATTQIVGMRLTNGNKVESGRYRVERRVLAVRWTFDDGPYVDQGLAANDSTDQEVRFPPVAANRVKLTILESTHPGDGTKDSDTVSISSLQFLSPG